MSASGTRASRMQMFQAGSEIFNSLMRGERHEIPVEVVRTMRVDHVYVKELQYEVSGISALWTSVSSHENKSAGTTIIPVIRRDGTEYIGMIFKPQPTLGEWAVALPVGALKPGESPEVGARRELHEEMGMIAGKVTWMMSLSNSPDRSSTIDQVFIAEEITMGSTRREYEEKPIRSMLLSRSQVAQLLDSDMIRGSMTVAVLSTYLRKSDPVSSAAFENIRRGQDGQ